MPDSPAVKVIGDYNEILDQIHSERKLRTTYLFLLSYLWDPCWWFLSLENSSEEKKKSINKKS